MQILNFFVLTIGIMEKSLKICIIFNERYYKIVTNQDTSNKEVYVLNT